MPSRINLFSVPNQTVDTSRFSSLLADPIVTQLEQEFAAHVGAKYALALNSASSAIFLIFKELLVHKRVSIPSIIPAVVANSLINAGARVSFEDNVGWVGSAYTLYHSTTFDVIDSAQQVSYQQFANTANPNDLMIFSFYPTKPISGCDGGMIVSDDRDKIELLRLLANNGQTVTPLSWERKNQLMGWKLYMNSFQAQIVLNNLRGIRETQDIRSEVRMFLNKAFGLANTSDHLYRIEVEDNREFVNFMDSKNIQCGIHYAALHEDPLYSNLNGRDSADCPKSSNIARRTVSIPFHVGMNWSDIDIIKKAHEEYGSIRARV